MAVPYTFGTATASIPLSQLDSNFATTITLGNTAIQLGNTVTTLNNMTLANVTVSSGNVTFTNVSATTANVTTANITTAVIGTATITTAGITTANVTTGNVATLVTTSVTNSGLTSGRVVYTTTGGLETSSANLAYNGTTLTLVSDTTVPTLSVLGNSATPNLRLGSQGNTSQYWNIGRDNLTTGDFIFANQTSEKMRIAAGGNLLVGVTSANANGGILQLSSGITFPATAVAATNANTLDDYEEGSWTPVFSGYTGTYNSQTGKYVKIGQLVYIECLLQAGTVTFTTPSNTAVITGLPFAAIGVGYIGSGPGSFSSQAVSFNTTGNSQNATGTPNCFATASSTIQFAVTGSGGGSRGDVLNSAFGNNSISEFSCNYRAT